MSDKIKVVLLIDEWYPVVTPDLDLVGDEHYRDHEIEVPRDLFLRYEKSKAAFDEAENELFSYYWQTVEGQKAAELYGR